MSEWFRRFAANVSNAAGSVSAFLLALFVVLVWATTGPVFGFSDTWQLVINTGTTIVTFLMVFLIQNTQNRDARALHTKLDELIVATKGARNRMVTAEELSDEELANLKAHFEKVAERRGESREAAPPTQPLSHPKRAPNGRNSGKTAGKK